MAKALLTAVMLVLETLVTKENLKLVADKMLDAAEDVIASTDNKIDDQIVLPIIQKIRATFDIPDFDDPPEVADAGTDPV